MTVRVGGQARAVPVSAPVPGEPEPQVLSISAFSGEWVVLVFYPRDFTFVCPTELRVPAELEDDFVAAGAQVIAASTDSYWSHRAWSPETLRLLHALQTGELCPVDWRPGTPTLRPAA
jgi:peroxiredoxin (alkyl hydroperoxide reductase subunit C)